VQVAKVTFLYKLREGQAGASFGLNVAMLAGLPHSVVARASQIAHGLQKGVSTCAARVPAEVAALADATRTLLKLARAAEEARTDAKEITALRDHGRRIVRPLMLSFKSRHF
jgi:DNA mismatch repair ATPase MutS